VVSVRLWIAYIVCDAAFGLVAFLSTQHYPLGRLSGPEFIVVLLGDATIFVLVSVMWRGRIWPRVALCFFVALRIWLSPYQSIEYVVGDAVNVAIYIIRYLLLLAATVTMVVPMTTPAVNAWFASRRPGS
jgi:hypothetical protein